MDERTCPVCGAAFVPRRANQKYCSAECAAETSYRKNQQDETIKAIRAKRREEEKRERAAREARLKRRDDEYAAHAPRTVTLTRNGITVESRGMVPVAAWKPPSELRVQRPGGYGWKNF